MIHEKIKIKCEGSGENTALYTYILDGSAEFIVQERPVILVCPGGGYSWLSDREAEVIALQFNAMGYHAAVLKYSVAPARFPASCLEVGKALLTLREHAEEWKIKKDKIAVIGFSAGGHLTASYCMFWNKGWMAEKLGAEPELLRPNAMLLGYPVITSGEHAHDDSFYSLLGDKYEELKDEVSLEKQVNEDVPPSFIWNTYEDALVPVQNGLLLAAGLVENHIPVEYHMFQRGAHGLSLANEVTENMGGHSVEPTCQCWIEMLRRWLENWRKS